MGSRVAQDRDLASAIRVGLVDDHPAILASIAAAIAGSPDLELIGTATEPNAAIRLGLEVDVLVCDVQLAGRAEGLDVLRALHDPSRSLEFRPPAVIFVSGFRQPSLLRAAVEQGAAGYVSKTAEVDEIVSAIRTVAHGGTVYAARDLRAVGAARRTPSAREVEVLELVRQGRTNAEIASSLALSEKTVESHLRRLFDRYAVLSRTELTVLAIEEGWVATQGSP